MLLEVCVVLCGLTINQIRILSLGWHLCTFHLHVDVHLYCVALSIHHLKKGESDIPHSRAIHTLKLKLQEIMKGWAISLLSEPFNLLLRAYCIFDRSFSVVHVIC